MDESQPDRAEWKAGPRVAGAGGVEIATWDLGGEGAPLLAVHATGFHARTWLPLAPVLGRDRHVWALDLRGHGRSGHSPSGEYRDWDLFATDLLAVVDALGLADAPGGLAGVGHSLGGAVLLLAEQRRPGIFDSLYCYEPIVIPPSERAPAGGVDLSRVARKRRARFPSLEAAAANYRAKPPFAAFCADALDAYVAHAFVPAPGGGVELACRPEEEASVYEGALASTCWEALRSVTSAVTVAAGGDGGAAAAHVEQVVDRLPAGRLERYDDLGHFGPMQDPVRVGQAIRVAVARAR